MGANQSTVVFHDVESQEVFKQEKKNFWQMKTCLRQKLVQERPGDVGSLYN